MGLTIDPNWKYVKSGLQRNISQTVMYYRSRNFSVKSNHLLVRFLNSCSVSVFGDINEFYNKAQQQALVLGSHYEMTSSISRGKLFDGVFFGTGSKEIIIAVDDSENPEELEANWEDISPLTFIDHPKSDTSLLLANGKAYSKEEGTTIVTLNIPSLLLQYRCWLKRQVELTKQGLSPYPTSVFIHKYVIPNALASQIDIAVFNRINNLVQGAPMGVPLFRHAFNLINYDDRLDKVLKEVVKKLGKTDKDFFTIMREIPMVSAVNLLEIAPLPDCAPTIQFQWAQLLCRMKLVAFLIDISPSSGKKQNRQQLNALKKYFDQISSGNVIEHIPDKVLARETDAAMIYIRALALR